MFEHRFVKFMDTSQKGYELWVVELVNDSYRLISKETTEKFNYFDTIKNILDKGVLVFQQQHGEWVYVKTVER